MLALSTLLPLPLADYVYVGGSVVAVLIIVLLVVLILKVMRS